MQGQGARILASSYEGAGAAGCIASPLMFIKNKLLRENGARGTKNYTKYTCIFSESFFHIGRVKRRCAKLSRSEQSLAEITGAGRRSDPCRQKNIFFAFCLMSKFIIGGYIPL